MNRDYINWLESLPCNRKRSRSWVGVYQQDDYNQTFEQWQERITQRDAPRGVIARWMNWLNS